MESEIKNSFSVQTFRPNEKQFKNFGRYVREIEKKCQIERVAKSQFKWLSTFFPAIINHFISFHII